jgi:hypothetical protein
MFFAVSFRSIVQGMFDARSSFNLADHDGGLEPGPSCFGPRNTSVPTQ